VWFLNYLLSFMDCFNMFLHVWLFSKDPFASFKRAVNLSQINKEPWVDMYYIIHISHTIWFPWTILIWLFIPFFERKVFSQSVTVQVYLNKKKSQWMKIDFTFFFFSITVLPFLSYGMIWYVLKQYFYF
jgi:hypothetical protein